MKIIKIIVLFATISFFTSIHSTAEAKTDCSNPEGFHQKLMCKFGDGGLTAEEEESKAQTKSEKKKAKAKAREDSDSLEDMVKKINKNKSERPNSIVDFFKSLKKD